MPWSFVSHIEQVIKACRLAGFEQEIPIARLRTEMMRTTGVTNHKKLAEYIRVMVELGYVRMKSDFVVEFCLSFALPYQFPSQQALDNDIVSELVKDGKSKD